jgi:hypothetical protein
MPFRLPVITRQTESSDRFGQCSGGGGESNSPETMLSYLCRFVAEAFEPSKSFWGLILERGGGTLSSSHCRLIRLRSDLTAVYVTRGSQKCPDSFCALTNHITGPSASIPLVTSGVLWEKAPMVLLSL